MNEHQISNNISNAVTDNLEYLISYAMLSQMKINSLCKDFISHFEDVTNTQIKGHKVMNNIQESEFESWYDSYDKRTPQDPFDRWLARKGWDAAMQSPEVQALREDAERLDWLIEHINDIDIDEGHRGWFILERDTSNYITEDSKTAREAITHARRIDGGGK